jgi:hypothetical protein
MQKLFAACDSEADALNERMDDLNDGIMRLVSRHFSVLASARLARQVLRQHTSAYVSRYYVSIRQDACFGAAGIKAQLLRC